MSLPQIRSFDLDFIASISTVAEFQIEHAGLNPFVVFNIDGWTVGYECAYNRHVLIVAPGAARQVIEVAENGKYAALTVAFAVVASLRLAADPIAAAVEWMHVMVKRHGHTVGLGMAHLALGTELYHEAFGQWEDEDNARHDAQTTTA